MSLGTNVVHSLIEDKTGGIFSKTLFGVIHLVRTHEGGEGGSSKCVRMRTRGEGGLAH